MEYTLKRDVIKKLEIMRHHRGLYHLSNVFKRAATSNSLWIAASDYDQLLFIDIKNPQPEVHCVQRGKICWIQLAQDGRKLIYGTNKKTVVGIDVVSLETTFEFNICSSIIDLESIPNDDRIIVSTWDNQVQLWRNGKKNEKQESKKVLMERNGDGNLF